MKHYQLTGIMLCVILLGLSTGCKKDRPGNDTVYSFAFSEKVLAYVQLKEGKYLIYKDSATQRLDSVVVTTSKLETVFTPKISGGLFSLPAYNDQNFELVLSKFEGNTISVWFKGHAVASAPFVSISTNNCPVDLYEPDYTLAFSLAESDNPEYSITIEGKKYNNVVVRENAIGLEINDPAYKRTIYYWAKGVGLIKRTLITTGGVTKTYTLLRNN